MSSYDDKTVAKLSQEFTDDVSDSDKEPAFLCQELGAFMTTQQLQIDPKGRKRLTHDFTVPVTTTAVAVSLWVVNALEPDTGWPCQFVHIQ